MPLDPGVFVLGNETLSFSLAEVCDRYRRRVSPRRAENCNYKCSE
jgi:hypothetical protein